MIASLVANIGILCVFKYYNFFIDNFNVVLHALSLPVKPLPLWNIILPLGLSFHTFQAMSYTIEIYRGNQKPERHFGIYALYVMFYPQLVAGPIERPQNVMHQYHEFHRFDRVMFLNGLRLMMWGFFKKLVIADRLATYVNVIYASPSHYHSLNLILASIMFSVQIYCDFSGYSDIAIGSAQTMGFTLLTNFNRPYLYATSITEFWRRWHISLYTWFNDYLYTPVVVTFRNYGKWGIALALFITFSISGLWHGADWAFVIWGGLYAIALIYEMLTKKIRKSVKAKPPKFIYNTASIFITLMVVNFLFVFFRAAHIHLAVLMLKSIFTNIHGPAFVWFVGRTFGIHSLLLSAVSVGFMFLVEKYTSPGMVEFNANKYLDILFCTFVLAMIFCFGIFTNQTFIYFQF